MSTQAPVFGIRIPPCADVRTAGAAARAAEEAGFEIAWYPDSQFLWRDVWATLAVAALETRSIRVGSCVTTFETRHPSVTAAATRTVAEIAPGRTILGVGSGDSAIKLLGMKPTRLAGMRRNIAAVRRLLEGHAADYGGREIHLHGKVSTPVPVYMAATGPKALQLAGEIADGVIVLAGLAQPLVERALGHIRDGAARAGRSLEDLDICVGTFCHITDDPTEAARVAKPVCVGLAQVGATGALQLAGIEIDVPAVVPDVYPDMTHAEDWMHAAEVAGRWVSDEDGRRYAERFCVVGTAEECTEKIRRARDAGVRNFYIRGFPSYELPLDLIEVFGSDIIPAVT
ncbi:MAG: LLM class flavin-dependent oxidoreductase [bacterium]|nr:LLM class flavin-dependent oxidoreductase [bacterium]